MKPKTLTVKAAFEERPVFMPHRREMIDGRDRWIIRQEAVVVPNTRYYQNRIRVGDLVRIVETIVEPVVVDPIVTTKTKKAGK